MIHPLINVQSLKKSYLTSVGTKHVLKGLSFNINQAEVFCLMGANGAGKTTLSSIIAGLHPPTSGDILFSGRSIYKDIVNYKRNIGLCPQKPNLDPTLSLENTLKFAGYYYGIAKREIEKRIEELMHQFELDKYKKSKVGELSGGYRQRFLLARTLIHRPKLIILDEPTVGLDLYIKHQLWRMIKALKEEGNSILLTTHHFEEAKLLADKICILDEGLIKVMDTPNNLKYLYQEQELEDIFLRLIK